MASHTLAAAPDPPASVACRDALQALDAHDAQRRSGPAAAPDPARQSLQRHAAIACLGGDGRPQAAQRQLQAPISVSGRAATAAPPRSTPPEVTAPATRPYSVSGCDPGGCWASDGSRLQRVGPDLLGPRGFCTLNGALLNCP